jgi:hypothetical protein
MINEICLALIFLWGLSSTYRIWKMCKNLNIEFNPLICGIINGIGFFLGNIVLCILIDLLLHTIF